MVQRILSLLLLFYSSALAQSHVLDNYVKAGIENNLALKQERLTFKQSLQKLNQARGMFLPSIGIEARYSRAGGGRVIEFPVGDLFNPIYATLNEFQSATGQPPRFPTNLSNELIPFLREEEHDTKVRIMQPIFQPAIYHNYKLKSAMASIQKAETAVFARQLAADIKTAYFNYLKTTNVVELLTQTELLLNENLRVSEKLFQAEMATKEVIYRARAEISALAQQKADAVKNRVLARNYFNFLLNRPLDSPIIIDNKIKLSTAGLKLKDAQDIAIEHREEFNILRNAINAAQHSRGLANSAFLPNIVAVLDYGYQGEQYRFTEEDDYWMASGVLQWNLFNGFQDKAKRQQASLEKKKLELQLAELLNKIKLQVRQAYENIAVAKKAIESANEQLKSARASFKIVDKKFRNGSAPQIEYLNARTTMTNAEINLILAKYDYQIKQAEFERIIAHKQNRDKSE